MNAAQAKKISLFDLLNKLGYSPADTRKSGNEVWYKSPFRNESDASFKIKIDQNVWYDFGEGEGGNVLDFVMKYKNCSFKDALAFLDSSNVKTSNFAANSNKEYKQPSLEFFNIESPLILNIKPVFHFALKEYLKGRQISPEVSFKYLKELNYKVNDKEYFALGFPNISEGWEVRSSIFKGCLGKKDISLIETGSDKLNAFEGFMDFLSCLTIRNGEELVGDVLILNSTSMKVRGVEIVRERNYKNIDTYFDNDKGGKETFAYFKKELAGLNVVSHNQLYEPYKDFNDYLKAQIGKQRINE